MTELDIMMFWMEIGRYGVSDGNPRKLWRESKLRKTHFTSASQGAPGQGLEWVDALLAGVGHVLLPRARIHDFLSRMQRLD
mmetsp:Transcript_12599/g.25573  ORF Transcript_12599/g.25573 Transcript_12599/m.25573 type:complete len:81 (-) Transcript_12599:2093-2335(-)